MHKGYLTVGELLYREMLQVTPEFNLGQIRQQGLPGRPAVLVRDEEKLVGILLWRELVNQNIDPNTPVQQVMRKDFSIIEEDSLDKELLAFLPELRHHALVCVNARGQVLGVLAYDQIYMDLVYDLCRSQAQLNAILEAADEVICLVDGENRVTAWNSRAESLYGIKKEDIMGQPIERYIPDPLVLRVNKEWEEIRSANHEPCPGTHVLMNALPVRLGPKIIGGVVAERDITEIIELNQELSEASSQVKRLEKRIDHFSLTRNPFAKLKGNHKKFHELLHMARQAARTNTVILLRGESGTGKELLARSIHDASPRAEKPFVIVNCSAIPPSQFESEVFGYEPGHLDAADPGKPGLFELAAGGTVFLDEVGDLPMDMQLQLVRVFREGSFTRVGGVTPVTVDLRVIAATHRHLEAMIDHGEFREDLYYRLNVVTLKVPPLRERREDIPELVYLFVQEYAQLHEKHISRIDPEVMAMFLAYAWPGNVRELKNVIERMVILTEDDVVTEGMIPDSIKQAVLQAQTSPYIGLNSVTEQTERDLIVRTLKQAGGNRSEAARMLGIPRSTLYYKMHQLGIM